MNALLGSPISVRTQTLSFRSPHAAKAVFSSSLVARRKEEVLQARSLRIGSLHGVERNCRGQHPQLRWQRHCGRQRCTAISDASQTAFATQNPEITNRSATMIASVSEGLETPVQLIYLFTLLGFLVVGAYLVVRQVLIRRELEEAAKVLGERIRTGSEDSEMAKYACTQSHASAHKYATEVQDLFQLGVILLRKKLFTQAVKHLEKAKTNWQGDPEELAQVHNALGFAFFNISKNELAIREYREAVSKQPGYVTALNNLGDAYEKARNFPDALATYQEALNYAPNNKVAAGRVEELRGRV